MEKSHLFDKLPFLGYAFCNAKENAYIQAPLLLNQIHSIRVIDITQKPKESPQADAWVTTKRGLALTLKTADCAPVLFAEKNGKVIGAAHAGWKGAMTGILEQTLIHMMRAGAEIKNIFAVIGPCIHVESYPVSEEMKQLSSPDMMPFFEAYSDGIHFNLPTYVEERLKLAGIPEIEIIPQNTFSNAQFNSFRRDKEKSGRQYSSVWLDF